jgi:VanZ family protein
MPALSTMLQPAPHIRRALHALALLLFAGILIAGSVPGARAEVGNYASGIVLHSLAYAFLTLLWFLGATGSPAQRALKAVVTIMLMGAADELVQSFLPYRSGDVRDWLVDATAAVIASSLLAVLAMLVPAAPAQPSGPARPR